jgi:titin
VAGTAALANAYAGVGIGNDATNNTIGGASASARDLISGNGVFGVLVVGLGTNGNQIANDYIGLNTAATGALGNGLAGVQVQDGAAGTFILSDIISGNAADGVVLSGPGVDGNVIQFNRIGTNAAGTAAVSNPTAGVLIRAGASGNTLSTNVISGNGAFDQNLFLNTGEGVLIDGAGTTGNSVQGNFIGTDASGMNALGDGDGGVKIADGASNNSVGGAARNVISGQINTNGAGVFLNSGATGNSIMSNYIGLNAAGTAAVGWVVGVSMSDSTVNNNAVGFNVISGNTFGVALAGPRNLVFGNYIGLNAAGTAAVGNGQGVIIEFGAAGNTVGGTVAAARNVISGNTVFGVRLTSMNTSNNVIDGNFIGTRPDGVTALGNNVGVQVDNAASNNMIGGTAPGAGNVIAFSQNDGVVIGDQMGGVNLAGVGNSVLGNRIFGNGKIGIDLGASDGVTANNSAGHSGPNNFQNFPALTSATSSGPLTIVRGTLSSNANTLYRLEFFANPSADPSGHGQGQIFLGFFTVTTDGSGNASFIALLGTATTSGQAISATATDASGDTSEFSADVTVS